jgi:hypothetical protein
MDHSYSYFPRWTGRDSGGGWVGFSFLLADYWSRLMRCGMEEVAAPLGLSDFWLVNLIPPLTQWAKFCRASGALD